MPKHATQFCSSRSHGESEPVCTQVSRTYAASITLELQEFHPPCFGNISLCNGWPKHVVGLGLAEPSVSGNQLPEQHPRTGLADWDHDDTSALKSLEVCDSTRLRVVCNSSDCESTCCCFVCGQVAPGSRSGSSIYIHEELCGIVWKGCSVSPRSVVQTEAICQSVYISRSPNLTF